MTLRSGNVQSLLEEAFACISTVQKKVPEMPHSENLQNAKNAIESVLSSSSEIRNRVIDNHNQEVQDTREYIEKNAKWRKNIGES